MTNSSGCFGETDNGVCRVRTISDRLSWRAKENSANLVHKRRKVEHSFFTAIPVLFGSERVVHERRRRCSTRARRVELRAEQTRRVRRDDVRKLCFFYRA